MLYDTRRDGDSNRGHDRDVVLDGKLLRLNLQAAMVEHLTRQGRPARFDLMLQVRNDARPEVIDNPTVTWDVPTFRVATLTIPPQQFASPEQMRFCEALSFTPWHALPEHRPLGEINAVRREVYLASSALRHKVGKTAQAEPTGTEHLRFDVGLT